MNFSEMKALEPELRRLEDSARFAGQHQTTWWSVLLAVHEPLTKLVGRGAVNKQLQSVVCYEVARAALFAAWSRGADRIAVGQAVEEVA